MEEFAISDPEDEMTTTSWLSQNSPSILDAEASDHGLPEGAHKCRKCLGVAFVDRDRTLAHQIQCQEVPFKSDEWITCRVCSAIIRWTDKAVEHENMCFLDSKPPANKRARSVSVAADVTVGSGATVGTKKTRAGSIEVAEFVRRNKSTEEGDGKKIDCQQVDNKTHVLLGLPARKGTKINAATDQWNRETENMTLDGKLPKQEEWEKEGFCFLRMVTERHIAPLSEMVQTNFPPHEETTASIPTNESQPTAAAIAETAQPERLTIYERKNTKGRGCNYFVEDKLYQKIPKEKKGQVDASATTVDPDDVLFQGSLVEIIGKLTVFLAWSSGSEDYNKWESVSGSLRSFLNETAHFLHCGKLDDAGQKTRIQELRDRFMTMKKKKGDQGLRGGDRNRTLKEHGDDKPFVVDKKDDDFDDAAGACAMSFTNPSDDQPGMSICREQPCTDASLKVDDESSFAACSIPSVIDCNQVDSFFEEMTVNSLGSDFDAASDLDHLAKQKQHKQLSSEATTYLLTASSISEPAPQASIINNTSYDFFFGNEWHHLADHPDPIQAGNEIMESGSGMSQPHEGTFNDLPLYLYLLNQRGCVGVDLAQVHVRSNSYILGIRSIYRCKWKTGAVTFFQGDWHVDETGLYARDGGKPTDQTWILEPDEFLVDCVARQAGIVDGLWFLTNHGQSRYFGGYGGYEDVPELEISSENPIVALAGTYKGAIHRVGYFKRRGVHG